MPAQNLAVKAAATPLLIGAASLAGRRFGHHVGGWLVGLPLASGPGRLLPGHRPRHGYALSGRHAPAGPAAARATPRWDIPVRMLAATTVVFAITASAPVLGAHLAGLLSPLPVFGAVQAVSMLAFPREPRPAPPGTPESRPHRAAWTHSSPR